MSPLLALVRVGLLLVVVLGLLLGLLWAARGVGGASSVAMNHVSAVVAWREALPGFSAEARCVRRGKAAGLPERVPRRRRHVRGRGHYNDMGSLFFNTQVRSGGTGTLKRFAAQAAARELGYVAWRLARSIIARSHGSAPPSLQ